MLKAMFFIVRVSAARVARLNYKLVDTIMTMEVTSSTVVRTTMSTCDSSR